MISWADRRSYVRQLRSEPRSFSTPHSPDGRAASTSRRSSSRCMFTSTAWLGKEAVSSSKDKPTAILIEFLSPVAGGRSRLHLIDLGGCANRSGGLPLSGVGNVVLSVLSGQRHPPNRDHPLTPLLKDCLAPLTCHVAIIAHVAHSQVRNFISFEPESTSLSYLSSRLLIRLMPTRSPPFN
jgi:hypothetical protein